MKNLLQSTAVNAKPIQPLITNHLSSPKNNMHEFKKHTKSKPDEIIPGAENGKKVLKCPDDNTERSYMDHLHLFIVIS